MPRPSEKEIYDVLREVDEILENVTKPYKRPTNLDEFIASRAKAVSDNIARNTTLLVQGGLHIIYKPKKFEIIH